MENLINSNKLSQIIDAYHNAIIYWEEENIPLEDKSQDYEDEPIIETHEESE